jgi:hypothetical protein
MLSVYHETAAFFLPCFAGGPDHQVTDGLDVTHGGDENAFIAPLFA